MKHIIKYFLFSIKPSMFVALLCATLLTSCSVEDDFRGDTSSEYLTLNTMSIEGKLMSSDGRVSTRSTSKTNTIYTSFSNNEIVQIKYDFTGTGGSQNIAYAKYYSGKWTLYTSIKCTTEAFIRPNGKADSRESWENLTMSFHFHPLAVLGISSYPTAVSTLISGSHYYYDLLSATTRSTNTSTAGTYRVGIVDSDRGKISVNFIHNHALVTVTGVDVAEYIENFSSITKLSAKIGSESMPFVGSGSVVASGWKVILPVGELDKVGVTLKDPSGSAIKNIDITLDMRVDIKVNHTYAMNLTLRPDENEITIVTTGIGWLEDEFEPITDAIEGRDYSLSTPGNKNSNWTLYTAVGLATYRNWVNASSSRFGLNAMLGSNIDMSSVCYPKKTGTLEQTWVPIANEGVFTGTFDGNGKTLTNLYINNTGTLKGIGLIAASSGEIKNLSINTITLKTTKDNAGSIMGRNIAPGLIINCSVSNVTISESTTANFVGGIVGFNSGSVIATSLLGVNNLSANSEVGGIVGKNSGAIVANTVSGSNTITANAYSGGIVGVDGVSNSYIVASVITAGAVSSSSYSGAIIGKSTNTNIITSYAESGKVSSSGSGVDNFFVGINTVSFAGKYPIANSVNENLNYAIADWNNMNISSPSKLCSYHFIKGSDTSKVPQLVSGASILGEIYVGPSSGLNTSNPNYLINRSKSKWIITDPSPSSSSMTIISNALKAAYLADDSRRIYVDIAYVTTIPANQFESCRALSSISFPNATTIGDYAFKNCDAISSISLPKAIIIGASAFYKCTALISFDLPKATTIGGSAFYGCMQITTIKIPTVTSIGSKAFYDCINLSSTTLPSTSKTMSIGTEAFFNCNSLVTIDLVSASSIGAYAFNTCDNLTTVNNFTVAYVSSYTFQLCPKLSTINLTDAITIGSYAFQSCIKLSGITLPNVVTISGYAFSGCSLITGMSLPNVTTIGEYAFNGCTSITVIDIPKKVNFGSYVFHSCTKITSITLGESTTVPHSMLRGCTALTTVKMDKVTFIDDYGFYNCNKLVNVSFPLLTRINYRAFESCTSLTTIGVGNLTTIGDRAFYTCYSLKTLDTSNLTTISGYAFYNCDGLTVVDLPNATTIETQAFDDCDMLNSISIPNVTSIGTHAFKSCSRLTSLVLPKVTSVSSYVFLYCTGLKSLTFTLPITSWGREAFGSVPTSGITLNMSSAQNSLVWSDASSLWLPSGSPFNFNSNVFCGDYGTVKPYTFRDIVSK